ncbi:hypothetical protein NT6N_33630 [Oceaniferula spumae]|uniref:HTH cro/C1-type domain-containing protein n=1 Tax=Oceaniferula spumae TaxID=2979115 RepID=A0AAT9FQV8_9BACT
MSEWTDIGEQLRKARESKGLDIRDVAHTTRIPLATLNALEESDYSVFPSPTYARSFLSQYSDYLQVDAHEWVEAFETGDVLSNVNDHEYLKHHNEHIGDNDPEPVRAKRSHSSTRREDKVSGGGSSILQTATVFMVTALLIVGGIYAYNKYEPMFTGAASDGDDVDETEQAVIKDKEKSTEEPKATEPVVAKNEPAEEPPKAVPVLPAVPVEPVEPVVPKPRTGPPPKAMVIDEEEE